MKTKKITHKTPVVKANDAIEILAKFSLTELRLITFCLAHYDSTDITNYKFSASIDDFISIFPSIDKKSAYTVIRKTMMNIAKNPIEYWEMVEDVLKNEHYHSNSRVWVFENWFEGFRYFEGEGKFIFYLNKRISQLFIGIDGKKIPFTKWRLENVYKFKSANTWKLYENLAQHKNKNHWDGKLDTLRNKLGLTGKYIRWADFKRDVIEPSLKEINQVSDLHVTYEKEKEGRKVVGLIFFIDSKEKRQDSITVDTERDRLYKSLLHYGVNEKTASDYADRAERQGKSSWIEKRLPAIKERYDKKRPDIPFQKYLLGALKDEFNQGNLLYQKPEKKIIEPDERDYLPAMDCWQEKRRHNEECTVRKRGAGQRKKCQICLEKIPVKIWGL